MKLAWETTSAVSRDFGDVRGRVVVSYRALVEVLVVVNARGTSSAVINFLAENENTAVARSHRRGLRSYGQVVARRRRRRWQVARGRAFHQICIQRATPWSVTFDLFIDATALWRATTWRRGSDATASALDARVRLLFRKLQKPGDARTSWLRSLCLPPATPWSYSISPRGIRRGNAARGKERMIKSPGVVRDIWDEPSERHTMYAKIRACTWR